MKKAYKTFWGVIFILFVWSVFYYPYEYGRWWHLLVDTPHMYDPNILEEGADLSSEKEYVFDLEFKYFNYYDVGVLFKSNTLTSSLSEGMKPYIFSGNILVEIFNGNEIVRKKIIDKPLSYKFSDVDIGYYKAMVLDRFPLPVGGKYSGYKLKITVLEGDSMLTPDKTSLYFSVSSSI